MSSPTEEHREAAWAIIKASRVFSPEVSPDWPTIREKHKLMEGRIAQALADESEKAEAERDAALAEAKGLRDAAEWLNAPFDPAKTCGPINPPNSAFMAGWKEAWYVIGSQFRAALAAPSEPPKEAR